MSNKPHQLSIKQLCIFILVNAAVLAVMYWIALPIQFELPN